MAVKGPRKKPASIERLQGNPGKRPRRNEPQAQTPARKPWGLDKHNPRVSRLWDQHAPELERLGILTGLDVGGLRLCLQHYQFAIEAAAAVVHDGMTRINDRGLETKSPSMAIFTQNSEMYRKWAAEFGLTPSSRSRFSSPLPEQPSMADLLFGIMEEAERDS